MCAHACNSMEEMKDEGEEISQKLNKTSDNSCACIYYIYVLFFQSGFCSQLNTVYLTNPFAYLDLSISQFLLTLTVPLSSQELIFSIESTNFYFPF